MTHQQWNTGPQGGQPHGQPQWTGQQQWGGGPPQQQQPKQSNTLWWVLIGIAAAGLVAIIVWVVLATGNDDTPVSDPVPPAQTSTGTDGEEPGGQEPGQQGTKDLSDPSFPDSVGGLQKTSEQDFPGDGVLASYEGDGLVLSASVSFDNTIYDDVVANDLTDRQRIGSADCGYTEYVAVGDEDLPPIPTCAINGSGGFLSVGLDPLETTSDMTLADLAAFTEELHAGL